MSTCYFDDITCSFADVPVTDSGVETLPFLDACTDLVKLFDLFGSKAFTFVQSDLTGNITKIRTRYDAFPDKSKTLESLVENEQNEKKKVATEGLLWLTRGLNFTCKGLRICQTNPQDELSVAFEKGYETTLKPHHSFAIKPLFGLALKACPYRADLYQKLGEKERVDVQLARWLEGLEKVVTQIQCFYEKGKYDRGF